jgi:hypothetical protein
VSRKHAITISVAAGLAVVAGTVAATKTIELRPAAAEPATASPSAIAKRTAALDRAEVALGKALSQRPPKLPPLPQRLPAVRAESSAPTAPGQTTAGTTPRVVYVRPAPTIRQVPRADGDDEAEHESEHVSAPQADYGEEGDFDD